MSAKDIENNLNAILSARYGEEVRRNIHDAIAEVANMTSDEQSYRPSNVMITTPEQASRYFTDANDAPLNEGFLIGNLNTVGIANLPNHIAGAYLYLMTFGYSPTNKHGKAQIAISYEGNNGNGKMYWRVEIGSGDTYNWGAWVSAANANEAIIFSDTYLTKNINEWDFNDLNDAENGKTYLFTLVNADNITIENLPENFNKNSTALLITIPYSPFNKHGKIQFLITQLYNDTSTSYFYWRMETGSGITDAWTKWNQVKTSDSNIVYFDELVKGHSADIFTKVVACGDSYTSGHIFLDSTHGGITNENFAWPKFMSKLTGNDWINCGRSGANVITWQTDARGLPKAKTSGKAQAYVIGLGLNDAKGSAQVDLGAPSDIGTDNQTYYAQYAKIIRELNQISPEAKIFVQTMPNENAARAPYNEAIRTIASQYAETYDVHLLELTNYKDLYESSELASDSIMGHYTAIGYQKFAEYLRYVMSEYIDNHVSDFQDVYRIPTE